MRMLALGVLTSAAASLSSPAVADAVPPPIPEDVNVGNEQSYAADVDTDGEVTVELSGSGSVAEPAVSVSFGGGGATVTVNVTSVVVPEIVQVDDPDEEPNYEGACLRSRRVLVPVGQEDTITASYNEVLVHTLRVVLPDVSVDVVPACVADDEEPGGDPVRAFEELLAPFVEQLPRPRPVLNPESAITGLDTYLETNRPLRHGPVDGQITLGGRDFPVTLWAEGVYRVDWGMAGEGQGQAFERVSGPHTQPGRPFEEGRPVDEEAVTHVYTSVPDGPLSVSVTDYWVVHYSIAGVVEDATLVAELEPVSVPVEVREFQAVVISD